MLGKVREEGLPVLWEEGHTAARHHRVYETNDREMRGPMRHQEELEMLTS